MRRFIRLALLVWFAVSILGGGLTLYRIGSNPVLRPLVEAGADQIVAATDVALARRATPEVLAAQVEGLLAEEPRNWIALDALLALAEERGIVLAGDAEIHARTLRDEDFGLLAQAATCALCAWDAAQCSLDAGLCLSGPCGHDPGGRCAGHRPCGGWTGPWGPEVDQIDLALSVVGLGATAAVLATGGSSGVVKAGAGLARMARKMGRLSPRLVEMAGRAAKEGVDWARLPAARSIEDVTAVVRWEAIVPLTATLGDLDRLRAATDLTATLHLLPLVDSAEDARILARSAEAPGSAAGGPGRGSGQGQVVSRRVSVVFGGLGAGRLGVGRGIVACRHGRTSGFGFGGEIAATGAFGNLSRNRRRGLSPFGWGHKPLLVPLFGPAGFWALPPVLLRKSGGHFPL